MCRRAQQRLSEAAKTNGLLAQRSILLTEATFHARLFLREVHANTEYDRLVAGRAHLEQAVHDRQTTLRQLVGNHFDRFVEAKQAIDRVHVDMRERGLAAGDHGTRKALEAVLAVSGRAQALFQPLLARQAQESLCKRRLAFVQRHAALFSLPSHLTQIPHYDQTKLIGEYRQAKQTMTQATGQTATLLGTVWKLQVEPALAQLQGRLLAQLALPHLPLAAQLRLVETLRALELTQPDPLGALYANRRDALFSLLAETKAAMDNGDGEQEEEDDLVQSLQSLQHLVGGGGGVSGLSRLTTIKVPLSASSQARLDRLAELCQRLNVLLPEWFQLTAQCRQRSDDGRLMATLEEVVGVKANSVQMALWVPQAMALLAQLPLPDPTLLRQRLLLDLQACLLRDAARLPQVAQWNGQSAMSKELLGQLEGLLQLGEGAGLQDLRDPLQAAFLHGLRSLCSSTSSEELTAIAYAPSHERLPLSSLSLGNRQLLLLSLTQQLLEGHPDPAIMEAFLQPRLSQLVALLPESSQTSGGHHLRSWVHQLLLRLVGLQSQIMEIDGRLLRPLMTALLSALALPINKIANVTERLFLAACLQTITPMFSSEAMEGEDEMGVRERVQALLNTYSLTYACFQYT